MFSITVTLLSLNTFAGDSLAKSSLGFYPLSASNVPQSIREAAQSVVFIAVPAGALVPTRDLFNGRSVEEAVQFLETLPFQNNFQKPDKDIYLYQLRQCLVKKDKVCPVSEGDMFASGYVVGDGSVVRTAYHEIRDLVKSPLSWALNIENSVVHVRIPVFIYNQNGVLVASPEITGFAQAQFTLKTMTSGHSPGSITLPNDDVADVQFPLKIAPPLRSALAPPSPHEPLYILGFPQHTDDRKTYSLPDAPGLKLTVSVGQVLTLDEMYRKMGRDPVSIPSEIKDYFARGLIPSSADGAPGLSGGATLNSKGEVWGTYTAGYPADGAANANRLSYSSNNLGSSSNGSANP
jgi:hypothetical protein